MPGIGDPQCLQERIGLIKITLFIRIVRIGRSCVVGRPAFLPEAFPFFADLQLHIPGDREQMDAPERISDKVLKHFNAVGEWGIVCHFSGFVDIKQRKLFLTL
jgi:hypothetical protein